VVAAALARRAADLAGAHRGDTQRIEGNLGWPGEPPAGGGGLGWPGDLAPDTPAVPPTGETRRFDQAEEDQPEEDQPEEDQPEEDQPEEPAPQHEHNQGQDGRRRGWRRLLGFDRAA
jgi:hypothetical protein